MSATWIIAKKEFRAYFNSPIAYIFLVIFLVLTTGYYVLVKFLDNYAYIGDFFTLLPLWFTVLVPALTMRLWAEERKIGTDEILLTLPVTSGQVVVGKFLAALGLLLVALLLTFSVPLTIALLGNLDPGPVIGGYLGALLMGGTYLALGLFLSSVTTNQILAFILTIAGCLVLFMMGFIPLLVMMLPEGWVPTVEYFSVSYHFQSIARGLIDTRDLIYFLSIIVFFLFLNVASLEARKWK